MSADLFVVKSKISGSRMEKFVKGRKASVTGRREALIIILRYRSQPASTNRYSGVISPSSARITKTTCNNHDDFLMT